MMFKDKVYQWFTQTWLRLGEKPGLETRTPPEFKDDMFADMRPSMFHDWSEIEDARDPEVKPVREYVPLVTYREDGSARLQTLKLGPIPHDINIEDRGPDADPQVMRLIIHHLEAALTSKGGVRLYYLNKAKDELATLFPVVGQ